MTRRGKPIEAALARLNQGAAYWRLGDPRHALSHYTSALASFQLLGETVRAAQALTNMGVCYRELGELQAALESLDEARALFEEAGQKSWLARALSSQGDVYASLGDPDRAVSFYRSALELRRAVGDRRGEATTLNRLGNGERDRGNVKSALEVHSEALRLAESLDDPRLRASVQFYLGLDHAAIGQKDSAWSSFQRAIAGMEAVGNRLGEAESRLRGAEVLLSSGDSVGATRELGRALKLAKSTGWAAGEAQIHVATARSLMATAEPQRAVRYLDAAIEIAEMLRTRVEVPGARATLAGTLHKAYELRADLLMARGDIEGAFAISERARARVLLDLLTNSRRGDKKIVDTSLLARRNRAREGLDMKTMRRLDILSSKHTADRLEIATREVDTALAELDLVESQIRQAGGQLRDSWAEPVDATGARELLDSDTLLLEYMFGESRSFLWVLDAESIEGFELPARETFESLARAFHQALRTPSHRAESSPDLVGQKLSQWLLGPIRNRLDGQRLVVVGDGALHVVPLAALPLPLGANQPAGVRAEPVITRHEVVYLPSASALAAARRTERGSKEPRKKIALFANPVFSAKDPRLGPGPDRTTLSRAQRPAIRGLDLGSLPGTGREANAIARMVDDEQILLLTDLAARRDSLFGAEIAEYRVLHLATHGIFDVQRPQLSGLVLSLVDEAGNPESGFVSLRDLEQLETRAHLVVLSGCETALGAEIKGEGLVGLPFGFLQAGARQVIASQWKVQDRPTADLMTHFYRALWQDQLTPSAALRKAQLRMRTDRRWRDPYYWAAFVLWGDWEPPG